MKTAKDTKTKIADESKWVDWKNDFGDKIGNFDRETLGFQGDALMNLIYRIVVSLKQETKQHEFVIHYNLPIV